MQERVQAAESEIREAASAFSRPRGNRLGKGSSRQCDERSWSSANERSFVVGIAEFRWHPTTLWSMRSLPRHHFLPTKACPVRTPCFWFAQGWVAPFGKFMPFLGALNAFINYLLLPPW